MKRLIPSGEMFLVLWSVAFGLLILVPYVGCLAGNEWALKFMGVR